MGIDSQKAPPLPAPTETESESVVSSPTELPDDDLASEADKTADQESSFSLPDDGTPITIKTRGHHKPNRSQTSLLIEYFETTKTKGPPKQGSSKSNRRPSVRVRLAPSKHHDKSGHIQITETKSSGKSSTMGRRNRDDGPLVQSTLSQLDMTDPEDSRSMNSYASATEESNVSRQPIEVDIDPNQYRTKKERKASSPLIPATDSKASLYVPPNMSDISVIPTDSFLDGETGDREERRSRSPRRSRSRSRAQEPTGVGSVAAAAAAVALEKKNRRPRSESHDRRIIERAVEKASRPESKHRSSKSRRTSIDKGDAESRASARRRSRNGHKDSVVSAADSSVLSSQLSPSHRSYDSHASSKVSINNPKLLETVEDAIRRLILPELSAIKRERSVRETRQQPNTKQSLSSLTSVSREELSTANKRKSADTTHSTKSRGREARNDLSPRSSLDHTSLVESIDDQDGTPPRAKEPYEDPALLGPSAAAGAAMGSRDRSDDKRQRRRRRAKTPERGRASEEYRDTEYEVIPPMPLSSEVNPSEMTRTSILSADTDRPHSASEEMTPVREVPRGVASMESLEKAPTPTRTPLQPTLQVLGAQHANISHGDLKALPRQGPGEYDDREYNDSDLSQNYTHEQYDDEYDDDHVEPGVYERGYFQQDVPPPLRYVPYQQERRGLSPIQSVSGYTENESDLHHRRDSRATQSDLSSPGKSISSMPSHMRSREFGDDISDLRSSGYYQDTQYTDGSDVDRVSSGQAVQGVGANPQIIHQPFSTESAVASLVDGSALSAGQRDSQISYDSRELSRLSRGASPTKKRSLPGDRLSKPSRASQEFSEYDLDEYGRKVPRQQNYQHSPSPSEAAIISRGFAKAAAAIAEKEDHSSPVQAERDDQFVGEGVSRNRSFKERTKNGYQPNTTPRHSVDRLSDYEQPRLGASGLPDSDYPMPEIGWGYDKSNASSVVQDPVDEPHNGEYWQQHTPTQEKTFDFDRAATPKAGDREGHGIGIEGAAAAAAVAAAAGMATAHSRQPSQDQDDEWQRTSMDRKRDTLVTNPYEGTSPIANLPGLEGFGSPGFDPSAYRGGFNTGSPGMHQGDEGYETSAPNDRDMTKGKGVEHQNQPGSSNDPFFAPKHARQMSGLSQGMDSQFYDASTGNGIDRIESTDIIALMEHLMVRDAQRSARDQELIQTVVQITREMHTSFRDMKRALAESEDQIIGEVQGNTEKTVQRHLGGPRPLPGSASRSLQGYSQTNTLDDLPAKKRGLFRRALKGLNSKGTKDLTRIEDMLMHLLTEVDVLKHQTGGGSATLGGLSTHNRSMENLQPEGQYEQDRGYEPEGNAGTSTASHASQSGHLSIPQARGSSGRMGYDRKFSDHRISTVDEGPEDEYDRSQPRVSMADEYSNPDLLMSPAVGPPSRAESVPLATPPPAVTQNQASMSNENTPATDNSKKHKSKGSSGFLPKISRWSETTTSSIGRVFRNSGQSRTTKSDQLDDFFHPPSRSGSNLDQHEQYAKNDPYGDDKLNSGYSEPDLMANSVPMEAATPPVRYPHNEPPMPSTYMTPEDPKYKAHRNSVNLQHPQPRPGQTERFRTALESSAINYDSPMSPKSADWAGSATSLHRFPAQQSNRYNDQSPADEYRNAYQSSPSVSGPPRPPKEPLDSATPPRNDRVNKLQKMQSPSPLAYQPMDSAYTTSTQVRSDSFRSGSSSPKPENKNLSAALNTPARRPSGPRAMTPSKGFRSPDSDTESIRSAGDQSARDDRRRKRGEPGFPTLMQSFNV